MSSKKPAFFTILFLLFYSCFSASAGDFHFAFTPYSGLEYSRFEEILYYEDFTEYSDQVQSLLEWEQKPAFLLGLKSEVWFKRFSFDVDFSTELPLLCGSMNDSDYWEDGLKFNYSVNKNYLDKVFDVKTAFSYEIDIPLFSIKPSIIASYSFISFNAKDGHGWYGSSEYSSDGNVHAWNSEYSHYFPDGKYHLSGVDYQNQTFYFMTGFELSHIFCEKFSLGAGFYFAPFTYTYVKDHHLGKSNNFVSEDYIYKWFENYRLILKSGLILSRHYSLVSQLAFDFQLNEKGENWYEGHENAQKGGETFNSVRYELGFRFSL